MIYFEISIYHFIIIIIQYTLVVLKHLKYLKRYLLILLQYRIHLHGNAQFFKYFLYFNENVFVSFIQRRTNIIRVQQKCKTV